jgi:hypothetical protein
MIAEIHSKISSTGSNLSNRLEDKLTGDVFGALRYLPFAIGLGPVLQKTDLLKEAEGANFSDFLAGMNSDARMPQYKFWPPHKEGEIDLLLDFSEGLIGIEVKYLSGISSTDDVSNQGFSEFDSESESESKSGFEFEKSGHQLARESRMLKSQQRNRPAWLIYLTKQGEASAEAYHVLHHELLEPEVGFGILSWSDVREALVDSLNSAVDPYHKIVLEDLTTFLKLKGFNRFKSFQHELPKTKIGLQHFSFDRIVSFHFDSPQTIDSNGYFNYQK